ncbi:hypothetical protein AeRB84_007169 [Aphanomyces euteiches]|nr:hypothetical protein AeRB84_007169 [Aphanomyces euteiches]
MQGGSKRPLRYLKKTRLYGLELRPTKGLESLDEVFADADWAGDKTSRRSTTGSVVTIGGCPTQWMSKRQGVVVLSTTEAEYIAASLGTQEAMWIRQLLIELGLKPVGEPTRLWCDNQSAIANMQNGATKSWSKHMDMRYHYVRDAVQDNKIKVDYCQTGRMPADIFTKALATETFERARHMVRVLAPEDSSIKMD